MKWSLLFLLLLVAGCDIAPISPIVQSVPSSNTLLLGTFNIQVFGTTKASNAEVMKVLVDTVVQYDVIAIQEFRDVSNKTIPAFLNALNKAKNVYAEVHSPPLGRSTSKENYAFFYDKTKTQVLGSYTYEDANDVFEREPFIAYFKTGSFDYVLINVHTKPDDATNEINELAIVALNAQRHFREQDIIILGDFNADGAYFDEEGFTSLKTQDYTWIVPNDYDTTVATSSNTYDRIVLTKSSMEDYAEQVSVIHFDTTSNLSLEQAKKVSDHYPLKAVFKTDGDTD